VPFDIACLYRRVVLSEDTFAAMCNNILVARILIGELIVLLMQVWTDLYGFCLALSIVGSHLESVVIANPRDKNYGPACQLIRFLGSIGAASGSFKTCYANIQAKSGWTGGPLYHVGVSFFRPLVVHSPSLQCSLFIWQCVYPRLCQLPY
jgi:hypothetical protein